MLMDTDYLLEYQHKEMAFVRRHASRVTQQGYVDSVRDLYPDLSLPSFVAYARGQVPLSLLLLMYDQTVLYIPPRPVGELENKFQMSLDDIWNLTDAGIIQPLIGHPTDYTGDHFQRLFEFHPPSVWARGLGMLTALGLEETLKEKSCPLPIASLADSPEIRDRYSRLFPNLPPQELTARIKLELLTNYADLWLFGEGIIADSLQYYSRGEQIINRLYLASEIIAYPVLFGLGGTPNYDFESVKDDPRLIGNPLRYIRNLTPSLLPRNVDSLLRGIGFHGSALTPESIIEFHSSKGRKLRDAVQYFEGAARSFIASGKDLDDAGTLLLAAERLKQELEEVGRLLRSVNYRGRLSQFEERARIIVNVGIPSFGALLAYLLGGGVLGAMGGAAVLSQLVPSKVRDKITDRIVSWRFSPGIGNLWKISKDSKP